MTTLSNGTVKFLRQRSRTLKPGFGFCFETFTYEKKYWTLDVSITDETVTTKTDVWRGKYHYLQLYTLHKLSVQVISSQFIVQISS